MTSKAPGLEAREKHKFQKATISGDILDVAAEEGAAKDPVQSFGDIYVTNAARKRHVRNKSRFRSQIHVGLVSEIRERQCIRKYIRTPYILKSLLEAIM